MFRNGEQELEAREATEVLKRLAPDIGIEIQSVAETTYELKVRGSPNVRRVLEWELTDDQHLQSIHYFCLVGYVADGSAFRSLLHGNCGGLQGSPFYTSILEIQGKPFLQWETRQFVGKRVDQDQLADLLARLLLHPIFLLPSSSIDGIRLFF